MGGSSREGAGGMAYQSLLPLFQSRSSQLSYLGDGIPSLVGGFDSLVRVHLSRPVPGSREGDRGDPDFLSMAGFVSTRGDAYASSLSSHHF